MSDLAADTSTQEEDYNELTSSGRQMDVLSVSRSSTNITLPTQARDTTQALCDAPSAPELHTLIPCIYPETRSLSPVRSASINTNAQTSGTLRIPRLRTHQMNQPSRAPAIPAAYKGPALPTRRVSQFDSTQLDMSTNTSPGQTCAQDRVVRQDYTNTSEDKSRRPSMASGGDTASQRSSFKSTSAYITLTSTGTKNESEPEVSDTTGETPSYNNLYPESDRWCSNMYEMYDNNQYPSASTPSAHRRSVSMSTTVYHTKQTQQSPQTARGPGNVYPHRNSSLRDVQTTGSVGGLMSVYKDNELVTQDSRANDRLAESVSNRVYTSVEQYACDKPREASIISASPNVIVVKLSSPHKSGLVSTKITWTLTTETNLSFFGKNTYEVKRKYSDFLWFHDTLHTNNFELIVPGIPAKANALTKQDAYFISKREIALQIFIDRCCRHDTIRTLESFNVFVSGENSELKMFKKKGLRKPLKIHRPTGYNHLREPRLLRAQEYLEGLEKHLKMLVDASGLELKNLKALQEAAISKVGYHDTWRSMAEAQMAGGYLHQVFGTVADSLQQMEIESSQHKLLAIRDYRSALKSLLGYVIVAEEYVRRVFAYQDTLSYWKETVDDLEKSINRKEETKEIINRNAVNSAEILKLNKIVNNLGRKLTTVYEEFSEAQNAVDKINVNCWDEIRFFDYVKDQDLQSIHVSRINALAEMCDRTLTTYTNAMKALQIPVNRDKRSIE
eukprot:CFRG7165T1